MTLSKHHIRILYIIAVSGTVNTVIDRHDTSVTLLRHHGYLTSTDHITHLSPSGYDALGFECTDETASRTRNAPHFTLWKPMPSFQWSKLL